MKTEFTFEKALRNWQIGPNRLGKRDVTHTARDAPRAARAGGRGALAEPGVKPAYWLRDAAQLDRDRRRVYSSLHEKFTRPG